MANATDERIEELVEEFGEKLAQEVTTQSGFVAALKKAIELLRENLEMMGG